MVKFGQSLAKEYHVNGAHAQTAMGVALSLAKGHRRRLRKGKKSKVPYVFKPFLRADDVTFHITPETGLIRLSLRNGEWARFDVKLSQYHLEFMKQGRIKQLVLNGTRAVLIVEKEVPERYAPTSLLALDTNERSLDGVSLTSEGAVPVSVPYPDVSMVQHRHFVRRRNLNKKKSNDRRVWRKLASKEGRRERNRVSQRLHLISKGLVELAVHEQAAIVLEDLLAQRRWKRQAHAPSPVQLASARDSTVRSSTRRRSGESRSSRWIRDTRARPARDVARSRTPKQGGPGVRMRQMRLAARPPDQCRI